MLDKGIKSTEQFIESLNALPEEIRVSALRKAGFMPPLDAAVDALPLPRKPWPSRFAIALLRVYRRNRPKTIGDRCVFEPSCSRYSELAIREHGVRKGLALTVRRLKRCRPGNGGADVLSIGKEITGEE